MATAISSKNNGMQLQKILMYACFLLFTLILISVLLRFWYLYSQKERQKKYRLKKDGICVIKQLLTVREIEEIRTAIQNNRTASVKEKILSSSKIQNRVQQILGKQYQFHDYIFSIKRSQIHTCHRDYNGDFFNPGQKHPSYTIIIYLENMDKCLEVIPRSHESLYYNSVNWTDPTEAVLCNAGDAILFNGNLIHSGAINQKEDNIRIQMKISHIEDHETLYFYQNYNKELDKKNKTSKISKYLVKHLSCQFPITGLFGQQYDYDVTKKTKDHSSLFSLLFYGDSQFYNLKNIS